MKNYGSPRQRWNESTIIRRNGSARNAENFYLIYDRLHEELLKRDLVHADETTCQVLREKGRTAEQTSYMWLYTTGNDGLTPIVLYDYQPSRKGSCVQEFLEGFHGMVQCDGY